LLAEAGQAVVVHPHRRLRRLAVEQGWYIVRPRRPRVPSRPRGDRNPVDDGTP
jgi:phosphoserine phosphatase